MRLCSGPALPSGRLGTLESLRRPMSTAASSLLNSGNVSAHTLAQRLTRGDLVDITCRIEPEVMSSIVQEPTKEASLKRSEQQGNAVDHEQPAFGRIPGKHRGAWEDKHLRGTYTSLAEDNASGVSKDIIRLIRKNSSYTKGDEISLLKKIANLVPVGRTRSRSQATKH